MKEVKYYISDDESKQSPNPEEIKEYEAKTNAIKRGVIFEFKDENNLPAILLKAENPKDMHYFYEYFRVQYGDAPDDYIGYAIKQYLDDEMYYERIITLKQYIEGLQKQIEKRQSLIDEMAKYV